MKGEKVTIITKQAVSKDILGNVVFAETEEQVDNVLVAPGEAADVIDDMRPDGTEVHYTLYFPKTFKGHLETGEIIVRGERLQVVGHPDRFDVGNCPTEWNMVVKVGTIHG